MNIKYRTINANQKINLAYEISYEKNIESYSFLQYVNSLKENNEDKFGIKFKEEDILIASRDKIFNKEEIFFAHIVFSNIEIWKSSFSNIIDESSHLLGKLLSIIEAKKIYDYFQTEEHMPECLDLYGIYKIV